MSDPFEVTALQAANGQVVVIQVDGELETSTVPKFQELAERIVEEGRTQLVVDCSRLDYISSSGLLIIQKTVNACRDDGGDLRLAALNEKNFTILDLLGFSKIIQCFDTVEEAVQSF